MNCGQKLICLALLKWSYYNENKLKYMTFTVILRCMRINEYYSAFYIPSAIQRLNQCTSWRNIKLKIDDFIRIEQEYDLYHLNIDNVQPWMYFRFHFWNNHVCKELLSLSDSIHQKSENRGLRQRLENRLRSIIGSSTRRVYEADIVFCAHPRRVKINGYYECLYTDCLLDKYPKSIVWERPFLEQHLTPVRAEHIYYTDLLERKAQREKQRRMKTDRYQRIYEQVQRNFSEPLKEISEAYHVSLSYDKIYAKLAETVLMVHARRKVYSKILDKIAPRLIVEVVYYSDGLMVLNELAKAKGIPVIELQHGTMHAAHAAYQFADGCGKIDQFPDYVFMFSDYWKKCAHLPINDTHIKVTGYPYFEKQLFQYKKTEIEKEMTTNIIFVSQGAIGQELSHLAADLCELLDATNYHIIYKLHPGEYEGWRMRNPELLKDNIEVIDSLEHSIYEYFPKCRIQIGVYSTAIYEGLAFGLTTYIYDVGHADTMIELCQQGYAVYVKNVGELYSHITANGRDDHICGEKFWKLNSLENICNEIDKLLEIDK